MYAVKVKRAVEFTFQKVRNENSAIIDASGTSNARKKKISMEEKSTLYPKLHNRPTAKKATKPTSVFQIQYKVTIVELYAYRVVGSGIVLGGLTT